MPCRKAGDGGLAEIRWRSGYAQVLRTSSTIPRAVDSLNELRTTLTRIATQAHTPEDSVKIRQRAARILNDTISYNNARAWRDARMLSTGNYSTL